MTHHVMTQMGHGVPNLIGLDPSRFDTELARHVPLLAAMSSMDMGDMAGMDDDDVIPPNSTPMMGGHGPHGYITMGGMFTVLKVRETLDGNGDPGWYAPPAGTLAAPPSAEQRARDGI
jgi:hypothetical protein